MRAILPLFPLGTVLFPGGLLPLRVFEARYVDMVRQAMRESSEFGVVLLRRGRDIDKDGVDIESIGCRARITNWNMEQLGVLQIDTVGTERFRIHSHIVQSDGLRVADVESIVADEAAAMPDDATLCVRLLERIVEQLSAGGTDGTDAEPGYQPIAEPYRFDDATWVANRLAELLPIALPAKQKLMAMPDALERLAAVRRYLVEQGIS